jgi:hypothetical protein
MLGVLNMSISKKREGAWVSRISTVAALVFAAVLVLGTATLTAYGYPDANGGPVIGQSSTQAYLPYTDVYQLPAGAEALGVHLAKQVPGAVDYGGRALLSDMQTPGTTVLIVKNGSLYQVSQ